MTAGLPQRPGTGVPGAGSLEQLHPSAKRSRDGFCCTTTPKIQYVKRPQRSLGELFMGSLLCRMQVASRAAAALLLLMSLSPVDAQSAAPMISGMPLEYALMGKTYRFRPSVFRSGSSTLVFSIINKPPWASFNTRTGELSGKPRAGDLYTTHSGVVISVSGGSASDSMPPFDIEVVASPGTQSMLIQWRPPVRSADGSPLTDLAGYRLYTGQAEGEYTQVVEITNPGLTSYHLDGLFPGGYFVALSAVDASGLESAPSADAFVVLEANAAGSSAQPPATNDLGSGGGGSALHLFVVMLLALLCFVSRQGRRDIASQWGY
jgi:hypothetical protein